MNLLLFLLLLLPLIHCEDAKWEPLRVHLHFDATVDSLLGARAASVKQTLRQVADFYQSALTIRRNTGPLRLAPYCAKERDAYGFKCRDGCAAQPKCVDYPIPRDHLLPCVSCTSGPPLYWNNKCTINGAAFTQDAYDKASTTPGVANTDLIVYVSATDAAAMQPMWRECGYEKLTRTRVCRRDLKWDRPNAAAMLIWKKTLLDPTTPPIKDIFMHEFLHILGLSSFEDHRSLENYDYFWKNETHPYRQRLADNVPREGIMKNQYRTPLTKEVTHVDWKTHSGAMNNTVTVLMTPRVKREVRHHFECDSLEGVELENHPRDVGHFESRLHRQDILSSRWIAGEKVTRLTFAYLEDSGWYKTDKTKASRMPSWQKGLGCDYAKKSCLEWMTSQTGQGLSVTPFCNHMSKSRTCGLGRTDVGTCDLQSNRYSSERFRYFANDRHGGGDKHSDSCPFVTNHDRALISCANPASVPAAEANYKNGYLQEFGPTSHCIDFVSWQKGTAAHTFGLTGAAADMPRGGCYKTDCSNNKLKITVAGTTHICTKAGETFTVEKAASGGAIKGKLVCPAYNEVCPVVDDDSYLNAPLDELEVGWTAEEEGGITVDDLLLGLGLWTVVYIGAGGGGALCLCCCICIICCICRKKKAGK